MSIISISTAQLMLYHIKHEFDMKISGKIYYFLSAILVTIGKISAQVMMVSPMAAYILNNQFGFWETLAMNLLANYVPPMLHNLKDHLINYWCTTKDNSGYYLESKFLPTTLSQNHGKRHFTYIRTRRHSITVIPNQDVYPRNGWIRLYRSLIKCIFQTHRIKNWTWYFWSCVWSTSACRRYHSPEAYQFSSNTLKSRCQYRERFSMALGM